MNNIPRPLFCVGEEVAVVSPILPEFNCSKTEIEVMELTSGMWTYKTSSMKVIDPHIWATEENLRKLPPPERTSWEDCIFQPNLNTVGAE